MKGLGARSPFVLLAALAAVLGIMAPRAVFEGRRMVSRWLRRVLLVVATVSAVATTPFVMGASPAAADSAPSISSVEPPTGASGTWVTITGSGFQNVGTVYFGNELAEAFRTISPTQVYAEAPPTQISSGDYVDIQVYSNAVSSAITTADQFTYRAASLNQEVASAPILHTIFWLPSSGHLQDGTSYSVSPTFIDNVNRLVSDFTLPNNSYWGILRQYGVGYPTYGGALVQPDDFPSRLGSSECFTGGNCITDADIRDLIGSAVKATPGWGQTINDIYIVVLAPGERAGAADGGCGYNLGGGIGIGDESWAVIQPCASAPGPYDEPSNSVQNSLAHEVAEAVTDPDASNLPFSRGLGWEFPDGGNNNQIGDACEGYKPQTGLFDLGEATVQFPDGDYFLLPALWSNAQTNPVVDGFAAGSSGCVWSDAPAPTIDIHADSQPGVTSQSSPPTLVAGQGFTVTATGLTPGSTATVNVGIDPGVSPSNELQLCSPNPIGFETDGPVPGTVSCDATIPPSWGGQPGQHLISVSDGNSYSSSVLVDVRGAVASSQPVDGTGNFMGVGCLASSACLAVGQTKIAPVSGQVTVIAPDGTAAGPQTISGTDELDAISCGATACVAIGRDSNGAPIALSLAGDGTVTQTIQIINPQGTSYVGYSSIACLTGTVCVADGSEGMPGSPRVYVFAPIVAGESTASASLSPGNLPLGQLACPTSTTCLASASPGVNVLTDSSGTWTV